MRLNLLFTGRLPTIAAWLATFVLLAFFRTWYRGSPITAELVVLTGIPMVLFTLYMITDPQTSPSGFRSQILFGSGIAVAYCILLLIRIQYTMFYSVTAVCAIRGMYLTALHLRACFLKSAGASVALITASSAVPSLALADPYPTMTSGGASLREDPSAVLSSNG
jgi:enediyne biosynthesis protein E5